MVVRIRVTKTGLFGDIVDNSTARQSASPQPENFALAAASLLTPSALVAFTMGFWIIASDLRGTRDFFFAHGLLSHWQTWIGAAGALLLLARLLSKHAREEDEFSGDRSIRP